MTNGWHLTLVMTPTQIFDQVYTQRKNYLVKLWKAFMSRLKQYTLTSVPVALFKWVRVVPVLFRPDALYALTPNKTAIKADIDEMSMLSPPTTLHNLQAAARWFLTFPSSKRMCGGGYPSHHFMTMRDKAPEPDLVWLTSVVSGQLTEMVPDFNNHQCLNLTF